MGPGAGIGERFLGGLRRIGTLPAALLLLTALLLSGDCGGSGGSGRSYPGAAAETDRTASALMAETGATALSVALYDGGRLAWTREYGVTDRASGRSVTPTTLFGFGSCSKQDDRRRGGHDPGGSGPPLPGPVPDGGPPGLPHDLPFVQDSQVVFPAGEDRAGTGLLIPTSNGREQNDLVVRSLEGEERLRFGGGLYRPLDTVPVLAVGESRTVTLAAPETGRWIRLDSSASAASLSASGLRWILYGGGFGALADSGTGSVSPVPAPPAGGYLVLMGAEGDSFTGG